MRSAAIAAVAVFALAAGAADDTARRKIDLIQQNRVARGSTVTIGRDELNLYVRNYVARTFRQGVRGVRVDLGYNRVAASAYIDFPALRRSIGQPLGRIMTMLLAGERRVEVEARIRSGGGKAQVDIERVRVSNLSITGAALDYLIRNFLLPYYPNAAVGRPFPLDHGVERLEVRPTDIRVVVGR